MSAYEIGFGRPPKEKRYKPGQSGNPAGRPRGTGGLSTLIAKALAEKVTINENGKRKRISKIEAAFKQLANKAASGDPRATRLAIELMGEMEALDLRRQAGAGLSGAEQQAADQEILKSLNARLGSYLGPADDPV